MPTVLRIGPYRFHFYSDEGSEPPHIHIAKDPAECKFWLEPPVLASNHGAHPPIVGKSAGTGGRLAQASL
ncbi:MAG: DUF4160 domain-containing protein [Spirochaetales bacterium]|nr:DUF4160 domain-containing protein [Spirochaetales bacterium]